MKVLRMLAALFCLLFLVAMNVPSSRADEHDKLTKFTFSGPVEVPGFPRTTVLPAGTYVFKLANSTSNRNIVQIFNEDQTHIYATVLAISNYRLTPSDKTIITFGERPAAPPRRYEPGSIPAITMARNSFTLSTGPSNSPSKRASPSLPWRRERNRTPRP